jgi:hypothetical protein
MSHWMEREDVVASVGAANRDESVQHKNGTFYLQLNPSDQSYRVTVLARK